MKQIKSFIVFMLFLTSFVSVAQNKLTGVVVDKETNNPLPYVVVGVKSTDLGVETDQSGNFSLTTDVAQGQLEITAFGYKTRTVNFAFNGNPTYNVGTIYLEEEALNELVIMARGVIDVAEGRKTPIA